MTTSFSTHKHGLLSVEVDQDRESIVIRAFGEIDITTAPTLQDSLREALERGTSPIILDLTAVRFIDSMGLRLLLWAAGRSRENGDRLRIDCGSGAARRMIDLTGFERSLPLTT